ncbi:MAG TPA: glycosyltransferase, partial [Candidatus Norongarragalinales archaeon]|nr:glycosyltransferase [Candidatus Norongarragalinales archaeon]
MPVSAFPKPHVLHCITDLDVGGAENMLLKLVSELRARGMQTTVVAAMKRGKMTARFEELGVSVHHLGLPGLVGFPAAPFRLRRILANP